MDDPKKDPAEAGFTGSLNEPMADAPAAAPKQPHPEQDAEDEVELPSNAELEKMTRAELDELAELREIDTSDCSTKGDVIDALRKDARKRKRTAKED